MLLNRLKCLFFGHKPEEVLDPRTLRQALTTDAPTGIYPYWYVLWVTTPVDIEEGRRGRGLNFCERCGELVLADRP